jgi:hypothetical protein
MQKIGKNTFFQNLKIHKTKNILITKKIEKSFEKYRKTIFLQIPEGRN